ncbi:CopG family ribbon-helix-helix protein [Natronorubrum halophilum]|uniref:CopG family ribbon-helix-helix protein n=1 Tax=Natronorubrum halophilum TaxID=1702106 RepID=UPI0010C1D1F4|nr:ribbon-helix-helix domain-containing protein [Natronorubrum halophilum]
MGNPSISIPDSLLGDVDAIAHARSNPGEKVSRSEVVRDALEKYVDEHEEEVAKGNADNDNSTDGAQATN